MLTGNRWFLRECMSLPPGATEEHDSPSRMSILAKGVRIPNLTAVV